MSKMSEIHLRCVELNDEMEDGMIELDYAIDVLIDEFGLEYDQAAGFLFEVYN